MTDTIFTNKRKSFNILKQKYFLKSEKKCIGLVKISNIETIKFLLNWLEVLPVNYFIYWKKEDYLNIEDQTNFIFIEELNDEILLWLDFALLDNDEWNINNFLINWISPILPENNYLSSLLREFNPLENEGNSYLYMENNNWSLYYAMIRYLENFKFPMDNRNLVKNIISL